MEELRESLKIPSGDRSSSKIIDCRQAKSGFSRGSISDGEFFINRGIFSNSWKWAKCITGSQRSIEFDTENSIGLVKISITLL